MPMALAIVSLIPTHLDQRKCVRYCIIAYICCNTIHFLPFSGMLVYALHQQSATDDTHTLVCPFALQAHAEPLREPLEALPNPPHERSAESSDSAFANDFSCPISFVP